MSLGKGIRKALYFREVIFRIQRPKEVPFTGACKNVTGLHSV